MTTIDIGIPAGRNSEHYLRLLVSSIERYTSKKVEYNYIIGVNDRNVSCELIENIFQELKIENYSIVKNIQQKSGISDGHGKCLDSILREMTSQYGVFFDSDVCVLVQDWDQKLINKLDEKNIIIGSEYHHTDGKIVNFPNVITCMFSVYDFKKLNISFVPKLRNITPDANNAHFYGVPKDQNVFLDTGCHICKDIRQAGYDGISLKIVSPRYPDTVNSMKFMKEGLRGEEYQLDGVPITTHVGRSSSRDFHNDPVINSWRQRIKEWMG